MNFLILVLLFSFFIFLYVVYVLSREDFVILRHDVPMEKIFNACFLFGISALISSRLLFVILNPSNIFRSFLGFLLFPYFPGLSLIGGLIGGFGFLFLYFKSRKLPVGRLMDFFSFGFLASYPVGLIGAILLSQQKLNWEIILSVFLSLILLSIFLKFILTLSLGGKLKDGTLTLMFFPSFSFMYIITEILITKRILSFENITALSIFVVSIVFLIKNENLLKLVIKK